jgi:hypothetical protein
MSSRELRADCLHNKTDYIDKIDGFSSWLMADFQNTVWKKLIIQDLTPKGFQNSKNVCIPYVRGVECLYTNNWVIGRRFLQQKITEKLIIQDLTLNPSLG